MMTICRPAFRRRILASLAILFAVSGCETLELVGRAPTLDTTLPDCIPISSCNT